MTPALSQTRRPLDLRAALIVLALCVIWGAQQVAMKAVAADVAPTMQLGIRFAGAAIFFGLWVFMREGGAALADGTLRSGVLLGSMFSLEFIFVGEALAHTTAAHTIVFLYSAPIFSALGLQFLPEERLRRLQWAGITVAFLGIVVAFLGRSGRPTSEVVGGDLLALLGGVSWGLSNVVLRRGRVGNAATEKTVFYQVGMAAVLLLAFAARTDQTRVVLSLPVTLALLFQTLVVAIASYLAWFWLLRHYLTSRLMLLSLLTPIFGVALGALLLGDPIDLRFAFGTLLVLAGILIVNARQILQRSSENGVPS
jgi:drug/metabolite transporter (DMT)-like permease